MFEARYVFAVLSGTGLRLEPSVAAKLAMRGVFFVPIFTDMEEKDMGGVWYEAGVMASENGDVEGIYVKIRIYNEKNDTTRDFYYVGALEPLPSITIPAEHEPWEHVFGTPRTRAIEIPVLPAKTAKEILEEMKSYAEKHPYLNLLPNGNKLKW